MKSKSNQSYNQTTLVEIGTQTDLFDSAELFLADGLIISKINSLFSDIQSFSQNQVKQKNAKLLKTFILELQNISKLIIQSPLKTVEDELSQVVVVVNLLEDLVGDFSKLKLYLRKILFSTSITIRERYIQSLQISQNYNLQRLELQKLLQVSEDYKQQESLEFSQEIKRLLIEKTLNAPLAEGKGLLTGILHDLDVLEPPNSICTGAQTDLTMFCKEDKVIDNFHGYDNQQIKDELIVLNKKYLDKIPDNYKRKLDIKRAYAKLSYETSELLHRAKNNPSISPAEYLSLLDDALEVEHSYISILKQSGFVEHSLYNALQKSVQIFKEYYEIIQNTDLVNEAKDWLLDLITAIQAMAANVTITRACTTIMHSECTREDEKARAQDTIFSIMAFDECRIAKDLNNHSLNVICAILNQAIVKVDWLPAAELKVMTETSELYLIKILNNLYPVTPFANNWINTIDLTVEQKDVFWGHKEYLGTIFEAEHNLRMLSEAMDLFHRFKICQLQKMQKNKIFEAKLFILNFRRDAYKYLLQPLTLEQKQLDNFERSLLYSEYTSQHIRLLTEAKQTKRKKLQQQIEINQKQEYSQKESIESETLVVNNKESIKTKKPEVNFDETVEQYNVFKLFEHMPEWDAIKTKVRFFIEKRKANNVLELVEKFLDEHLKKALDSEDIKFKNSIFDALYFKLEAYILLQDIEKAWDVLTILTDYLAPHQHEYLRNAQEQQLEVSRANLYYLKKLAFDKNSTEYKEYLDKENACYKSAHDKAQGVKGLCYSVLTIQDLDSSDLTVIYNDFDKFIKETNIMLNDNQLYFFYKLFNKILIQEMSAIHSKIDDEHYSSLISSTKFNFNPIKFDGLNKALERLDCLKNLCERDSYIRGLQAQLGFEIYKNLFEVVDYDLFYKKALKYAKLSEKYAFDSDERIEIQNNIKTFKNNKAKTDVLRLTSLLQRISVQKGLQYYSKGSSAEKVQTEVDMLKNFNGFLDKGIFIQRIRFIIMVITKVFAVNILSSEIYKNFSLSLILVTTYINQDLENGFVNLDEFYKKELAKKDPGLSNIIYEKTINLYEQYRDYLFCVSKQLEFESSIVDSAYDKVIQDAAAKIEECNKKIKIIKRILKHNDEIIIKNHFINEKIIFNSEMLDRFKKMPSYQEDGFAIKDLALSYLDSANYEIALVHFKNMINKARKLKLSDADLLVIHYLSSSILNWCAEKIFAKEFSDIFLAFRQEQKENSLKEVQLFFVKKILELAKKHLDDAKKCAKRTNNTGLGIFKSNSIPNGDLNLIEESLNSINAKLEGSSQEIQNDGLGFKNKV